MNYCADDGNCTPDNNEVEGPNNPPARRAPPAPMPTYILASGSRVAIPAGAYEGQTAWRVRATNHTLWMEQSESHVRDDDVGYEQYEYMLSNLFMEQDTVVGLVNSSMTI